MNCGLKHECKAEKCSFCVVGENGRTGFSPIDKEWNMGYQQGIADERPKAFAKGYDSGYQKGKEDALDHCEKCETDQWDALYKAEMKGRADALNIDMDKPMHFTDEQKAWVKNYIILNAERQRADAIEEIVSMIVNTPTKIKINHWRENDVLVDRQNEIIDMIEQLKEK